MSDTVNDYTVRGGCGIGGKEWVIDGPHGCIVGTFLSEQAAKEAADKWRAVVAGAIRVTWSNNHVFEDDSDRGDYCIRIDGTRYEWHAGRHWHAMEECIRKSQRLHEFAAQYGMETLRSGAAAL